jgi:pimeloyl-ACP methyl ester carboxylesterase
VDTLNLDGAQLVYEVEGGGELALAFVHGWCSMLEHWNAQAERFRSSYRVVRWDRRGMGRSTTEQPADSPARHADDLAAILDRSGIGQVVVIAHAGGGPTALAFTERFPERTSGLVYVDSRLHEVPGSSEDQVFAAGVDRTCRRLLDNDSDDSFRALYRSFFGPRASETVIDAAVRNALATPRDIAITELRHMLADTVAVARGITCPALSVSATPDDMAVVKSAFSDVMIGHVVGSGHFVPVEVPDQLNAMIATFLESRVLSAPAQRVPRDGSSA